MANQLLEVKLPTFSQLSIAHDHMKIFQDRLDTFRANYVATNIMLFKEDFPNKEQDLQTIKPAIIDTEQNNGDNTFKFLNADKKVPEVQNIKQDIQNFLSHFDY